MDSPSPALGTNAAEGLAASRERDRRGARIWGGWLGREFVREYIKKLREIRPDLLPANVADTELVLRSWVLEKALYEVRYELNSRPDWVDIPLRAIMSILDGPSAGGAASGVAASETKTTPSKEKNQ